MLIELHITVRASMAIGTASTACKEIRAVKENEKYLQENHLRSRERTVAGATPGGETTIGTCTLIPVYYSLRYDCVHSSRKLYRPVCGQCWLWTPVFE